MRIDIITLFPDFFDGFKEHSIIGRAIKAKKIEIITHDLRGYSNDKYKSVDDHPYGGGPGMVLRVDVIHRALVDVKAKSSERSLTQGSELNNSKVILLTPQGQVYKQKLARQLANQSNLILLCGHYEGFDERIREYVDMEISVGDYVMTGGEIPAMAITDSIIRLIPGVLGDDTSSHDESHSPSKSSGSAIGLLEYPQYTRPTEYEGKKVPEILLGGNHKEIDKWRREQSLARTKARRPDLLSGEVL